MTPLLLPPLLRDPLRRRIGTPGAAGIAAGILDVGAAGLNLARAGVDAALALAGIDADLLRASSTHAQPPTAQRRRPPVRREIRRPAEVAELIYELLDAHDDTAQMAAELACDPDWRGHLDYLQALQRKGRETLAHAALEGRR